jgi:site-specific recombinase XerD
MEMALHPCKRLGNLQIQSVKQLRHFSWLSSTSGVTSTATISAACRTIPSGTVSRTWMPVIYSVTEIRRRNTSSHRMRNTVSKRKITARPVECRLWPILDALKIPRCGLHAFRHTHSSMLVESGAPVSVAQAQLSHADPRVTLGIYSHVIGDSQRRALEKVAGILDYFGLHTGVKTGLIPDMQ